MQTLDEIGWTRKRIVRPGYGGAPVDRSRFWRYCQTTANQSRCRAKKAGIPHAIEAQDIDELIVRQRFACAISGIPLQPSSDRFGGPFAPSLDRITPATGYVRGNIRVVCQMVNLAMNEWGLEALEILVDVMAQNRNGTKPRKITNVT